MNIKTVLKKLWSFLISPITRIKKRLRFAKAFVRMEQVYQQQLKDRKLLRKDINAFLTQFFGINARSEYIPPNFRSNPEVKAAILKKFGSRMDSLNVYYHDLFR